MLGKHEVQDGSGAYEDKKNKKCNQKKDFIA